METGSFYPRPGLQRLKEALADTPAVLIHGPRQCGKTTLARLAGDNLGYTYMTFDNDNTLHSAREDPAGFCAELPPAVVLDEVQRVPELFTSLKRLIDEDRRPGRLILTGSANVLLLPRLADSLAGRMEILRLAPLTQAEIERHTTGSSFLERLFSGNFRIKPARRLGDDLIRRVTEGGFPAALARPSPRRRRTWHRNYIESVTQRDMRDLSHIRSLGAIPDLLELAASQTARLFNISELAAPFELSRPTIREYMVLLEHLFLVEELNPWHRNRLSRLIKTPKLHLNDTGLATALLGVDPAALKADRNLLGQLLETFVFQELRRHSTWAEDEYRFYHYRDKDQMEVDVVIEREGREVAGVEVKASSTVTPADFRGLRRLQEAAGKQFVRGVVLHDGDSALPMGENLFAVPYSSLWEA
jgi:predicted AAA+ superfamily ATPase